MPDISLFTASPAAMAPLTAQTDKLLHQAASDASVASDNEKIDKSANDFESILLSSWLQQAEQSFASVPGGNDDDDDVGKDQYLSIAMQSLGGSMTAAGGIGIAKMIAAQLHRTQDHHSGHIGDKSK